MKKCYQIELGVLWDNAPKADYDFYSGVYDKKHAYFDECLLVTDSFDDAKKFVIEHLYHGKEYSYGIVVELPGNMVEYAFEYEDDACVGMELDADSANYNPTKDELVYSAYKFNGIVFENFVVV